MILSISVKARLRITSKNGKFLFEHPCFEYVWKPPSSILKKKFGAMEDMAKLIYAENAKSFIKSLVSNNREYQNLVDENCDAQWWKIGFSSGRERYWSMEILDQEIKTHQQLN